MKCGAPVAFGTVCTKCLRSLGKNLHGYDLHKLNEDDRMRFFDKEINK